MNTINSASRAANVQNFDQTNRAMNNNSATRGASGGNAATLKQAGATGQSRPQTAKVNPNLQKTAKPSGNSMTRNMGGHTSASNLHTSMNLEDSIANPDRPAIRLDGLVSFLRNEYYRKTGIFINQAQNESDKLIQFWKDYVSKDMSINTKAKLAAEKKKNDPYYIPDKTMTSTRPPTVPGVAAVAKSKADLAYD